MHNCGRFLVGITLVHTDFCRHPTPTIVDVWKPSHKAVKNTLRHVILHVRFLLYSIPVEGHFLSPIISSLGHLYHRLVILCVQK